MKETAITGMDMDVYGINIEKDKWDVFIFAPKESLWQVEQYANAEKSRMNLAALAEWIIQRKLPVCIWNTHKGLFRLLPVRDFWIQRAFLQKLKSANLLFTEEEAYRSYLSAHPELTEEIHASINR